MLLLLHPFDNNPTAAAYTHTHTRTHRHKSSKSIPQMRPFAITADRRPTQPTETQTYVNKINLDKGHVYSRMYIFISVGLFSLLSTAVKKNK